MGEEYGGYRLLAEAGGRMWDVCIAGRPFRWVARLLLAAVHRGFAIARQWFGEVGGRHNEFARTDTWWVRSRRDTYGLR